VGYSSVLGVFEDGAWRGEPLPDRTVVADHVVPSAGRVGLVYNEALYVYEDGAVTTTDRPGVTYFGTAHADGALFAVGHDGTSAPVIEHETGSGWVPLPTLGLPAGADPRRAWADSPTDLWLAFDDDVAGGGGIAHWDGTAWAVVTTLGVDPGWMARLDDGLLYFTQYDDVGVGDETLWTWDGAVALPVPDLVPDVRAAHLFADGTRLLSAIAEDETGDLYGHIAVQDPGGPWIDLVTGDGLFDLVGDGTTAWTGSWTFTACP
jgi:hypothetical protein